MKWRLTHKHTMLGNLSRENNQVNPVSLQRVCGLSSDLCELSPALPGIDSSSGRRVIDGKLD